MKNNNIIIALIQSEPALGPHEPENTPLYQTRELGPTIAIYSGAEYREVCKPPYKSIIQMLFHGLISIPNILRHDGRFLIWENYGSLAVLFCLLIGRRVDYIFFPYKTLPRGAVGIRARLRRHIQHILIARASRIVVITKRQYNELISLGYKPAMLPFSPDAYWWTPAEASRSTLGRYFVEPDGYIVVCGDADRDESMILDLRDILNYPVLRLTRDRRLFQAFQDLYAKSGVGKMYLAVPYEDLREIYRGARYVFVPTSSERHPAGMTSVSEAMSCGKCVVVRDGMTTEGLLDNMHDAVVVEDWCPENICRVMDELEEGDRRMEIGRNARNYILSRCDIDGNVSRNREYFNY